MKLMTYCSHRKITEIEIHIQTFMILICHSFYGIKWNPQDYESITKHFQKLAKQKVWVHSRWFGLFKIFSKMNWSLISISLNMNLWLMYTNCTYYWLWCDISIQVYNVYRSEQGDWCFYSLLPPIWSLWGLLIVVHKICLFCGEKWVEFHYFGRREIPSKSLVC